MNILITGPFDENVLLKLKEEGHTITKYGPRDLIDEDDLIKALDGINVYIFGGDELATKKVIMATTTLKHIAFLGAGYERFVDTPTATSKGIIVTNTPGANKQAVAEMAIGLMFAAKRRIPFLNQSTKDGNWEAKQTNDIRNSTVGIVGMGHIGSLVATIMYQAFGAEILYYSKTRKLDIEEKIKAKNVSLEDLLKNSDIISLHTIYDPSTLSTKDLINESEFKIMKNNAILINTARAEIVNGYALFNALNNNQIASAGFDGYYTEPNPITPENDIYKLSSLSSDKFILTPHTAWRTFESVINMCAMAAEAVISIDHKEDYAYIVNKNT